MNEYDPMPADKKWMDIDSRKVMSGICSGCQVPVCEISWDEEPLSRCCQLPVIDPPPRKEMPSRFEIIKKLTQKPEGAE